MAEIFRGAFADHFIAGGRSDNLSMVELLERISEMNRKDVLQEGNSGLPKGCHVCVRENHWR